MVFRGIWGLFWAGYIRGNLLRGMLLSSFCSYWLSAISRHAVSLCSSLSTLRTTQFDSLLNFFFPNATRFTASNSSSPVILEFGHDTTIDLALTGLGLIKDSSPLVLPTNPPHTIPNPRRKWRTSYQVPFAARLVWEKFSCSSSSQGLKANTPYLRILLNNAPISLEPVCGSSKTVGRYGACALADFVKSPTVQLALNDATGSYKGASWNTTCGVTA